MKISGDTNVLLQTVLPEDIKRAAKPKRPSMRPHIYLRSPAH